MTTEQWIIGNLICGFISAIVVVLVLWLIPEPFKTDGLGRRVGTIIIFFLTGYLSLSIILCLTGVSLYHQHSLRKIKSLR